MAMRVPVKMRVYPCRYDHDTDARVHAHGRARVRAGATPPPLRRYVGFAGLGRRLVCWTGNAGPGHLLGRIGWGSAAPDAGLDGIGVGFLELVYGMGDPLKTYGEMACVENRGKRMGKCVVTVRMIRSFDQENCKFL